MNNRLVIGLLAHVDAGKTTLAERILYESGTIQSAGRVDHQNTFLDTHDLERARGITIFSQQANITWEECDITLLDTPGHQGFSTEMERSLQVLDCAILILSGTDLIQNHTTTIWELLHIYQIPTFLFINKMDISHLSQDEILTSLSLDFSSNIIDFSDMHDFSNITDSTRLETLAMANEALMEEYLSTNSLSLSLIQQAIHNRQIIPCLFGSALHGGGVATLLHQICQFCPSPVYSDAFAAQVFKVSRDDKNSRLCHIKITGGSLKVKDAVQVHSQEEHIEKINQIRLYSGTKFQLLNEAHVGMICTVTGLSKAIAGDSLGKYEATKAPEIKPRQVYQVTAEENIRKRTIYENLLLLAEEDPLLAVTWQETTEKIFLYLMEQIQAQVLQSIIQERFHMTVDFEAVAFDHVSPTEDAALDLDWQEDSLEEEEKGINLNDPSHYVRPGYRTAPIALTQEELDAIYVKTPDPSKRKTSATTVSAHKETKVKITTPKEVRHYLLVDGYNIIFAWSDLKELAELNLESARSKLMDILSNYQGATACILILVFDAYKVEGSQGSHIDYQNIHVVYTKEAETADTYIEKTVRTIAKEHHVTVATSDAMEQLIIMGQGAFRMSATDLREEIERTNQELIKAHVQNQNVAKNYLFHHLEDEIAEAIEQVRLGIKHNI